MVSRLNKFAPRFRNDCVCRLRLPASTLSRGRLGLASLRWRALRRIGSDSGANNNGQHDELTARHRRLTFLCGSGDRSPPPYTRHPASFPVHKLTRKITVSSAPQTGALTAEKKQAETQSHCTSARHFCHFRNDGRRVSKRQEARFQGSGRKKKNNKTSPTTRHQKANGLRPHGGRDFFPPCGLHQASLSSSGRPCRRCRGHRRPRVSHPPPPPLQRGSVFGVAKAAAAADGGNSSPVLASSCR